MRPHLKWKPGWHTMERMLSEQLFWLCLVVWCRGLELWPKMSFPSMAIFLYKKKYFSRSNISSFFNVQVFVSICSTHWSKLSCWGKRFSNRGLIHFCPSFSSSSRRSEVNWALFRKNESLNASSTVYLWSCLTTRQC